MSFIDPGAGRQSADVLQAAVSSVLVPLRVTSLEDSPFRVRIEHADFGGVAAARIRSSPHSVARQAQSITSTDPELFKLIFHRRGGLVVAQNDRCARMRPGDLVVCDTTTPYGLTVPDFCDVLAIRIPRSMLGANADLVSRLTAQPLPTDRGARAVLAAFLSGMADNLTVLPGPSGARLADVLTSLTIAGYAHDTPERVETATDLADRIVTYAAANLSDPHLSAPSVARRHGISVRHLHALLRKRGITFAAWVRTERLQRIRRDLLDPHLAQRTIASIAARWGLYDPTHIARALKKEYGYTAAELRKAATCGSVEMIEQPRGSPELG